MHRNAQQIAQGTNLILESAFFRLSRVPSGLVPWVWQGLAGGEPRGPDSCQEYQMIQNDTPPLTL